MTAVNTPSGSFTSTDLRLCCVAPWISRYPDGRRRFAGTAMLRVPDRNWPVSDSGTRMTSSAVPAATT